MLPPMPLLLLLPLLLLCLEPAQSSIHAQHLPRHEAV
jgi:hypothetical protein